jgi:hypothetical protein
MQSEWLQNLPDVDRLLVATREVAEQRGVPGRVLATEMILAATEAIAGVEESIGREALVKGIQTVLSNIADQHLREASDRGISCAHPVCPGPRNEARSDGDRERSGHGQLCGAR